MYLKGQQEFLSRATNAERMSLFRVFNKIVPNLNTTTKDLICASKLDFCNFKQDPEVALILYHLNRGVLHLKPLGDLKDENVKSDLVHNIEKEMLTDEEKLNLVKRFKKSQGQFCKIIGCGSCGIKEPQRGYDDSQ